MFYFSHPFRRNWMSLAVPLLAITLFVGMTVAIGTMLATTIQIDTITRNTATRNTATRNTVYTPPALSLPNMSQNSA